MITDFKHGLLFSRLSQEQLERVSLHSTRLKLSEGEVLFEQDSPANAFYLVTHGMMKLFRLSASGEEKIIEIVSPGQTFAEALMFLDIILKEYIVYVLCRIIIATILFLIIKDMGYTWVVMLCTVLRI